MQRIVEESISKNEESFIVKAIKDDIRIDGRKPYDLRQVRLQFSLDDSSATVQLGETCVLAVISAALEAPYQDRSREGAIRFNVELSPMASPNIDPGRPGELGVELARLMERGIKQSGAVDMEALCVQPGRKVWHLRVDAHVLNHAGNLVDACFLACMTALVAFKLPQVSLVHDGDGEGQLVVHPPEVREPQPLSLHHLPFAISFALFEDGSVVALDPSLAEEVASQGSITLILNTKNEVCGVQKADGIGLDYDQMMRCVRLAAAPVASLAAQLQEAVKSHEQLRVQARVRRRAGAAGAAMGLGPDSNAHVVMLQDTEQADARMAALLAEIDAVAAQHAAAAAASSSDAEMEGGGDKEEGEAGSESDEGMEAELGNFRQQQKAWREKQEEQQQQAGRAGPRLVGGNVKRKQNPDDVLDEMLDLKAAKTSSSQGKREGRALPVPSLDNLDAISNLISGAGGSQGAPPDLRTAIKQKGSKKQRERG